MKRLRRRVGPLVLGLVLLTGLILALRPRPIPVEFALPLRGPLEVAVLEDGRTRIKERYVVTAPLTGQLLRPPFKAGDPVRAGETVIARITPTEAALLDARAADQARARWLAAQAAQNQAAPLLQRAQAAHDLAREELDRARRLHEAQTLPRDELDRALFIERAAAADLQAAQFAIDIAAYEVDLARAALPYTQSDPPDRSDATPLEIRAPIDGRILRVFQESATVVNPGHPLLELGNPADLEVEIDVLSPDAVRIRPGARVELEHWGGGHSLSARVRRVEPAGFTKISALGVEEQRVWVIADLVDPSDTWAALGDAFRVEARIITDRVEAALKIPVGALFRRDDDWHVFAIVNGRARLQPVDVGLRNDREAAITGGLEDATPVIVHPGDQVRDGRRVTRR